MVVAACIYFITDQGLSHHSSAFRESHVDYGRHDERGCRTAEEDYLYSIS